MFARRILASFSRLNVRKYSDLKSVVGALSCDNGDVTSVQKANLGHQFCVEYGNASFSAKSDLMFYMAARYGIDHYKLDQDSKTMSSIAENMVHSAEPQFMHFLRAIGHLDNGVKFLVDLREDLFDIQRSPSNKGQARELNLLNHTLRNLLSLWFSSGMMTLQRITWNTSCDILEKISESEAVHPVRNWNDLKRRVGNNRRCYVFTHPAMPDEPLIVLHVALVDYIEDNIHRIVPDDWVQAMRVEREDTSKFSTAIFYSISATQKGLQGVDLGNYLIKRVVKELQHDLPGINQFSSLSPIPGFKPWLVKKLSDPESGLLSEQVIKYLEPHFGAARDELYSNLHDCFSSDDRRFYTDSGVFEVLKPVLMHLCSHYLFSEKRKGFAINPVANFHLRNGAQLWRLNWAADLSDRGLDASCGMMVNYRYFLDLLEDYAHRYLTKRSVSVHSQVEELMDFDTVLKYYQPQN